MESLAILSPPVSTRLILSGPTEASFKVLFPQKRRGVLQCVDALCHRWWLRKLDSHAIEPSTTLAVSWHIFASTLEGHVDLDVSFIEGTLKNELGETNGISQDESKNVDLNLNASKHGQDQWQGRRYAPRRKIITVDFDALKPGVILTGRVTNTERFGAFVDVGAFDSGLIHISNLSNKFVNSVEDIVKVGQEVRVEVVYASGNPWRLSLKLIREDKPPKVEKAVPLQEPPEVEKTIPKPIDKKGSSSSGRPQKGEVVTGSVTKIASGGVVVTLQQGHQGFLPASEVLSNGGSVETTSFFRVGQQIPVRVLRTTKDRITLTMKKQAKVNENREVVVSGSDDRATNPFELAFRRHKVISKFLEERERLHNISIGEPDKNSTIQSTTEVNPP